MICPDCGNNDIRVKDTRTYHDPNHNFFYVGRRRKCQGCGLEFKTIEIEEVVWQAVLNQGASDESDND